MLTDKQLDMLIGAKSVNLILPTVNYDYQTNIIKNEVKRRASLNNLSEIEVLNDLKANRKNGQWLFFLSILFLLLGSLQFAINNMDIASVISSFSAMALYISIHSLDINYLN